MCLVCNTYPLSARVTQPSTVRCTGEFWALKTSARGFELSATLPEATCAHAPRLINENTTPTKTTKYFCTNPPTTFFWASAIVAAILRPQKGFGRCLLFLLHL